MLALYIYIVLDRNTKQTLSSFFCVGLSDNPLWINDLNVTLCRISLVKYKKNIKKHLKEYAEYHTLVICIIQVCQTCPNNVLT